MAARAEGVTLEEAGWLSEKRKDVGQVSQWTLMRWRFFENKLSVAGLIVLAVFYLIAILAPFLEPYDPQAIDTNSAWQAPTPVYFAGFRPVVCGVTQVLDKADFKWIYRADCNTLYPIQFFVQGWPYSLFGIHSTVHLIGVSNPKIKLYLFGADDLGRDVFSRTVEGSRISLSIGLVGVALSVVIGAVLGTASGYWGGAADNLIQRFIEIIMSMPTLPLWAALAAALPQQMSVVQRYFLITVILSFIGWTGLARQLRGKILAYRTLDYTLAAKLAGASDMRIILTHMIPNALSHIIVVAALAVPATILGETALSFLGLGMLPPAVSWGVLLRTAQQVSVIEQHTWMLIPAVAVIVAVTCYQFLADGLRDAADPYS